MHVVTGTVIICRLETTSTEMNILIVVIASWMMLVAIVCAVNLKHFLTPITLKNMFTGHGQSNCADRKSNGWRMVAYVTVLQTHDMSCPLENPSRSVIKYNLIALNFNTGLP
ncbi:hypothetical protein D917_07347 [Trichinella nativa]|uniref:Uncharacterized protein n=1 Tax=Trichinella nativa TaxID=6335 RepID=A0A1Y3EQ72_9BILA|nr:hypothetical protein D917_07347 [Trichinella nativa]